MAFEIAGRAVARKGLKEAGAKLMEPMMKVEVTTPEESAGAARARNVVTISWNKNVEHEFGENSNRKCAAHRSLQCVVVASRLPASNLAGIAVEESYGGTTELPHLQHYAPPTSLFKIAP